MSEIKNLYLSLKEQILTLDESFNDIISQLQLKKTKLESILNEKQSLCNKLLERVHLYKDTDMVTFIYNTNGNIKNTITSASYSKSLILKELENLKKELESYNKEIGYLKAKISELYTKRKALEKIIYERHIIISLWKYISGDSEKEQLAEIKKEIESYSSQIKLLNEKKNYISNKLENCHENLIPIEKKLYLANKQKETLQKIIPIEDKISNIITQISGLKSDIETKLDAQKKSRLSVLKEISQLRDKIREIYPQLKDCNTSDFGNSLKCPEMLAIGRLRLSHGKYWRIFVPRLIPFPIRKSIRFNNDKDGKIFVLDFIFKVLYSIPLEQISITAIDPLKLGESLPDFQILLKNKRPFVYQRILTRSDEIEFALEEHLNYVEDLIQKVFILGISSWKDYNAKNPQTPLQYKLIVIYDIPEQLTDKSLLYLSRLIEHGPRCGIMPILTLDENRLSENRYTPLRNAIKSNCDYIYNLYASSKLNLKNLSLSEEREFPFPQERQNILLQSLAKKFENITAFKGTILDLFNKTDVWTKSSKEGIYADIGWRQTDNTNVTFALSDMPSHALVGGKTGSGKSNLLHVIIHSLCHNYSPNELILYLLDYKEGTEFNIYANPLLPNARLIATESDVEYGITVLRHLVKELQSRSSLFKQFQLTDYKDFRTNFNQPLPRIVLIIDEFHKIFSDDRYMSIEAENLLNDLLKQGRSFGIHILLATQTLHGMQNTSTTQLLSNIGARIALSCSDSDSRIFLGLNNNAASKLKSPPEGILNNANGDPDANICFNIPFASKETRIALQYEFRQLAEKNNIKTVNTIFNGNTLPNLPPSDKISSILKGKEGIPLLLGIHHDFLSNPFIIDIKQDNLLIAGSNRELRKGLLFSILYSLTVNKTSPRILYFSSADDTIDAEFKKIDVRDSSWDMSDLEALEKSQYESILIIDTFDYAKKLQSATGFKRIGTPDSPLDILKRIADTKSKSKTRIILFVENYKRFATSSRELFSLFDMRIGFGLDEAEAGNLVGNAFEKIRGASALNKAIYTNLRQNSIIFMKPYLNLSPQI